jgi:uncharacterized protein (TIRG00374 family)
MDEPAQRSYPRLSGLLGALAFIATVNLGIHGVRLAEGSSRGSSWVLIGIELVICGGSLAVLVRRIRTGAQVAPASPHTAADRRLRDQFPWLRRAAWLVVPVLVIAAAISVAGQWDTLEDAIGRLAHLHWQWVRVAIYAEALSIVAFAFICLTVLRAGGRRFGLGSMIGLSLASNALANSIPGGPAWAATFSFDQLRRRSVHKSLAACALLLTLLSSSVALIVLLAVGVEAAGDTGPAAPFRIVVSALVLLAVLVVVGRIAVGRVPVARAVVNRVAAKLRSDRGHRIVIAVRRRTGDLGGVDCSPRVLAGAFTAALCNWITDCGCLVAAILAVSGHVPWSGVLVAYAIGQVAENLPITPGGIGVVEGTLSLMLVAYGMHSATAVAAVLLYRLISFWILVPLGWATAAGIVMMNRRRRPAQAWTAPAPMRAHVTTS